MLQGGPQRDLHWGHEVRTTVAICYSWCPRNRPLHDPKRHERPPREPDARPSYARTDSRETLPPQRFVRMG